MDKELITEAVNFIADNTDLDTAEGILAGPTVEEALTHAVATIAAKTPGRDHVTYAYKGGTVTVTPGALEVTIDKNAHRTVGDLRQEVVERTGIDHYKGAEWMLCMFFLADWDHNVDNDPLAWKDEK